MSDPLGIIFPYFGNHNLGQLRGDVAVLVRVPGHGPGPRSRGLRLSHAVRCPSLFHTFFGRPIRHAAVMFFT